ncbi:MAG: hypothetical protein P3B76_10520 [Gemmatimonadota bacterium]|nr:hypothetical protein [Gemmatimonadota bacterium]
MPSRVIRMVLAAAMLAPAVLAAQNTDTRPATAATPVVVVGEGPTRWDARTAAVRLALQQVVQQLVIADRTIQGDSITRDQVISTLNGFVERFEVLEESELDGSYRLKTRVWVSAKNIGQYLAPHALSGGVAVRSDELLAQASAARLQLKSRGEMLARMFDGFPDQAIEFTVDPIKAHSDPMGAVLGDETVQLTIRAKITDAFVLQLQSSLSALDKMDVCRGGVCPLATFYGKGTRKMSLGLWDILKIDPFQPAGMRERSLGKNQDFPSGNLPWSSFKGANEGLRVVIYTEQRTRLAELVFTGSKPCGNFLWGSDENGLCLFVGELKSSVEVPLAFLEGAKSLRVRIAQ